MHNAALRPILCSLSLGTAHPLRVSRPSFMFKDYLLIQNAQEHEMEGKGPTHGGRRERWHGFICLLAFILIHWNNFPLFLGMYERFGGIKWKMEFSMDSM